MSDRTYSRANVLPSATSGTNPWQVSAQNLGITGGLARQAMSDTSRLSLARKQAQAEAALAADRNAANRYVATVNNLADLAAEFGGGNLTGTLGRAVGDPIDPQYAIRRDQLRQAASEASTGLDLANAERAAGQVGLVPSQPGTAATIGRDRVREAPLLDALIGGSGQDSTRTTIWEQGPDGRMQQRVVTQRGPASAEPSGPPIPGSRVRAREAYPGGFNADQEMVYQGQGSDGIHILLMTDADGNSRVVRMNDEDFRTYFTGR